jgi:apolipoprotein N-acyltransferase
MGISGYYRSIRHISFGLLVIAGLFLALAALPGPLPSFWPGIFFGFIPLFIANKRTKGINRFILNFAFSAGFALITIIPVDSAHLMVSANAQILLILLFLIIALFYGVFFSIAAYLSDKYGWDKSPLFFAICWGSVQYVLSKTPITFSFPLEAALLSVPIMLQTANIFGAAFVGAIIIYINAALAVFDNKTIKSSAAILLIMLMYGAWSMGPLGISPDRLSVCIIQPNVSSMDYYAMGLNGMVGKYFDERLVALTGSSLDNSPDLIVWPEMAGDYIIQNDERLKYLYQKITSHGADMLIGTNYKDRVHGGSFNIAFILDRNGYTTEPYRKTRVFPFTESALYSPSKTEKLIGTRRVGLVGPMICLESMYPQVARRHVLAGAGSLVTISTDASFGNSMIPYIHASQTVLRAIENGRYGIHTGNTGPSLACDDKGRILIATSYGHTCTALTYIYVRSNMTIFSRIGDIFGIFCFIGVVALIAKPPLFR